MNSDRYSDRYVVEQFDLDGGWRRIGSYPDLTAARAAVARLETNYPSGDYSIFFEPATQFADPLDE